MTELRLAWSFLTRLPGGLDPEREEELGQAVPWFPVVGLLLGLLVGVVFWFSALFFGSSLAAVFAVAASAILTGAFHEDGLADTCDSLGGFGRERRLEIMRDSRVGTFGVPRLGFCHCDQGAQLRELDGW